MALSRTETKNNPLTFPIRHTHNLFSFVLIYRLTDWSDHHLWSLYNLYHLKLQIKYTERHRSFGTSSLIASNGPNSTTIWCQKWDSWSSVGKTPGRRNLQGSPSTSQKILRDERGRRLEWNRLISRLSNELNFNILFGMGEKYFYQLKCMWCNVLILID